jgi:peptidoglycan/LPS O-acetylase OafA/YrhL
MGIAYRADIDGLRTIAVLLVVFNHLGWSLFSGGYIGVDIFFVISGYLISLILVKDLAAQRFSIARFYKKRVVRLAPAYFTWLGKSCYLMN